MAPFTALKNRTYLVDNLLFDEQTKLSVKAILGDTTKKKN